jgi:hypothetical protein
VTGLVTDARDVLEAVVDVGLDGEQERLVGLLALVAGQDVESGDEPAATAQRRSHPTPTTRWTLAT